MILILASSRTDLESARGKLVLFLLDLQAKTNDASELREATNALLRKMRSVEVLYDRCIRSMRDFKSSDEEERRRNNGYWRPETDEYKNDATVFLECFHYSVRSLFDMLARITWYLYRDETQSIPHWKFSPQRWYFTRTERKRNPEYTSLIERAQTWIDLVFADRNSFTHYFAPDIDLNSEFSVVFEHRKPMVENHDRDRHVEDLDGYLKSVMTKLDSFLKEWVRVHKGRLLETHYMSLFDKEP